MQRQQELLNSKDQQILRIKEENRDSKPFNDSYTFTDNRNYFDYNQNLHQCRQCKLKATNKRVQGQFIQFKMQKVEQQKKLMKKQIHELVYQCQKYKQSLKKMDEKYQKQLIQNQKLIKMISQEDFSMSNTHKKNSSIKFNLDEQKSPYLNLKKNKQNVIQHEPVSIKSGNYHSQKQRNHEKMSLNSPKSNGSQKMKSYNNGSSFIRYVEDASQPISDLPCQNKRKKQMNFFQYCKNQNEHDEIRKAKLRSTEWCQNQNIKKYLEQINKQKQKQFKQIEKLLKI